MDLISIIVPYYKKKRFIEEAINSVLKQTYKNIEIILIYDDAERGDLDYIKSIKNLDSRIKLIVNKSYTAKENFYNFALRFKKYRTKYG